MITETREITFSPDSLIEAILAHFRTLKQPLPSGDILGISLGQDPEITITLTLKLAETSKEKRIVVRPAVAGAAMIAYCKRNNIPVPRSGVKSLMVSGDSLSLVISTGGRPTALFEVEDA